MAVCYIFGALSVSELTYVPTQNDFIIAADKGIETLKKFNLNPDYIVGDFDSLGYVPKMPNVELLPVEKDDTDVGYAIKYALKLGYKEFVVYGALGGLLDHTIGNLQLSVFISKNHGKSVFVGSDFFATAITNETLYIKNGKGRLSVFSADNESSGVYIEGAKYPLVNAKLDNSFPLGISNEFSANIAKIAVEKGTLLVITQSKI